MLDELLKLSIDELIKKFEEESKKAETYALRRPKQKRGELLHTS